MILVAALVVVFAFWFGATVAKTRNETLSMMRSHDSFLRTTLRQLNQLSETMRETRGIIAKLNPWD